jgi:phage-related protein
MESGKPSKRIQWMGDSKDRLRGFPEEVRYEIGSALRSAQYGESHPSAKPMRGINAVEIVSDFDGDTFRGVYTTKIKEYIYVLHCFQKKSTIGIKTQKRDLNLIRARLRDAEEHQRQRESDEKKRTSEDRSRGGKR